MIAPASKMNIFIVILIVATGALLSHDGNAASANGDNAMDNSDSTTEGQMRAHRNHRTNNTGGNNTATQGANDGTYGATTTRGSRQGVGSETGITSTDTTSAHQSDPSATPATH